MNNYPGEFIPCQTDEEYRAQILAQMQELMDRLNSIPVNTLRAVVLSFLHTPTGSEDDKDMQVLHACVGKFEYIAELLATINKRLTPPESDTKH